MGNNTEQFMFKKPQSGHICLRTEFRTCRHVFYSEAQAHLGGMLC